MACVVIIQFQSQKVTHQLSAHFSNWKVSNRRANIFDDLYVIDHGSWAWEKGLNRHIGLVSSLLKIAGN